MKGIQIVAVVAWSVLVMGCDRYIDSRDPVRSLPTDVPVPVNLSAQANSAGTITLSWEVTDTAQVRRFRIYVADSTETEYVLRDSTATFSRIIRGLRVNQRYFFKVAVITKWGLQGDLSEAVSSRSMLLSIRIENGQEYTNNRNILIQINAPAETSHLMLSEDSTFADAVFVQFVGTQTSFELSDGDGEKTVYARLQFRDGSQTGELLSDNIILDTRARIESVFFLPGGGTLSPGETIRFGIDAGETDGNARVFFSGVPQIVLYDDGTNGDQAEGDGVYFGEWVIPVNFTLYNGEVTGDFTDRAGNTAMQVIAEELLNINSPPNSVELLVVVETDTTVTASFTWTESSEDDFASYRIYRGDSPSVDTSSVLIAVETNQQTVTFDYEFPEITTYYFRIYVFDEHGLFAGSNIVTVNP